MKKTLIQRSSLLLLIVSILLTGCNNCPPQNNNNTSMGATSPVNRIQINKEIISKYAVRSVDVASVSLRQEYKSMKNSTPNLPRQAYTLNASLYDFQVWTKQTYPYQVCPPPNINCVVQDTSTISKDVSITIPKADLPNTTICLNVPQGCDNPTFIFRLNSIDDGHIIADMKIGGSYQYDPQTGQVCMLLGSLIDPAFTGQAELTICIKAADGSIIYYDVIVVNVTP